MNKPIRKKSLSLFLLMFVILLIAILIILIVYLLNTNSSSENTSEITMQISVETETSNETETNEITNFSNFTNISSEENTVNSTEETTNNTNDNTTSDNDDLVSFNINNHRFEISSTKDASFVLDTNSYVLQINYSDYKLLFNTDNSTTYEELQNMDSLKDYLENTYNLSITSDIKSGNLNNQIDVIIFEISDDNGIGYFIITPLTDSEIAYIKVFNTADTRISCI